MRRISKFSMIEKSLEGAEVNLIENPIVLSISAPTLFQYFEKKFINGLRGFSLTASPFTI